MEAVSGIGGVFFRAKDPGVLREWYARHLGVDFSDAGWHTQAGPTVLWPFQQDTDYFDRPEQAFMLNFRVKDLAAMIAQLDAADVPVIQKDEWNSEFGLFARIHDPEGNPIELWQPPD